MTLENHDSRAPRLNKNPGSAHRKILCGATFAVVIAAPFSLAAQNGSGAAPSNPANVAGAAPNQSQPVTAILPAWDVVSVKPGPTCDGTFGGVQYLPNGIRTFCAPMLFVVEMAYGIREPSRILGVPDWIKVPPFYEITTKVGAEDAAAFAKLTRPEKNQMLQPLLADRFHMKAHLETRELSIYELRVAKGGPKLKTASADEASKAMSGYLGLGKIGAVSKPVNVLLPLLNNDAGRPVVDRTGLTGNYDFNLEYTPSAGAGTDATGPSLFVAIEEQLGLKLEPAKESIDVLVIDSMERPTEN